MGAIEVGMLNKIQQDLRGIENAQKILSSASSILPSSTTTLVSVTGASGYLIAVALEVYAMDVTITIDGVTTTVYLDVFRDYSTNSAAVPIYARFKDSLQVSVYNPSSSATYDASVIYSLDI